MTEETPNPEKTSAWEDKDAPAPEVPTLPAWLPDFQPQTSFWINGWKCEVLHVAAEKGRWLVLIEPQVRAVTRGMRRAEFRRLKNTVGKKKAWAMVHRTFMGAPDEPSNSE